MTGGTPAGLRADATLRHTPLGSGVLAVVRRRRQAVVQQTLWTLMAVVGATMVINAFLLGRALFGVQALAPNLFFVGVIGVALWWNGRGRLEHALGLIIGVVLIAVAVPLVVVGVGTGAIALFLVFVPVVMAGLLMSRLALRIVGTISLALILVPPLLRSAGWLPPEAADASVVRMMVLQASIVFSIVLFLLDRFGASLQEAFVATAEREVALEREMLERRSAESALLDQQRFTDAIVNAIPAVFYVLDEGGSYVRWNDNFQGVFGYSEQEIMQLRPSDLFEGAEKGLVLSKLDEVFETGDATLAATVVTKQGERIPHFFNGTRVELGGRQYLVGIGVDTSELVIAQSRIEALNDELRERLEHISALREIDRAITGSLDADLTLGVIVEQVRKRLGVDAVAVLRYQSRRQTLRFGAAAGFVTTALRTTNLRLGEGLAGRAALSQEPVSIEGASAVRRAFAGAEHVETAGFAAYMAVPLHAMGQLQGVLELFHQRSFPTDPEWGSFLDALAAQVAIALSSAALFDNLQRTNAELLLAYDTTIEGWAKALDLRDEETVGHSRRVTEMTVRLAERLGVSDEELVHVRRGALLHDIGKMGVPDAILRKPGKLTDEEWAIMKRHTTHALDLLAPIPFLRPALDIPHFHHEKWDGTGYPGGLHGEQIPLAARIFAVVDVYDALTSDRPYREAWSVERTLEHIRGETGTHFDPTVAEAFLAMIAEDEASA